MKRNHTTIIAEAGVNHNGDIIMAKDLVDVASDSGADIVKFQSFKSEKLVTKFSPKASYQKTKFQKNLSQYEMLKKLELSEKMHETILDHCKKRKISFLSSAFDLESLKYLRSLNLKYFKIPSGEINNLPYLRMIGSFKKKIFLSTGMSNLTEIIKAVKLLNEYGTSTKNINILHCNSEYPTPFKDVNLRAMLGLSDKFHVNVGYSDHTLGIEVAIAAVALGAKVIEKHFTLSKELPGPDHKASIEPNELMQLVRSIRNIELSLGNKNKKVSPSEKKNLVVVRKSIVANQLILKGEIFTSENLSIKRPGTGISPMKWDKILGRRAVRNFKKDELIKL